MAPRNKKNAISKEQVTGLQNKDKQGITSAGAWGLVGKRAEISRKADAEGDRQEEEIAGNNPKYNPLQTSFMGNKRDKFLASQRQRYETPGVMKKARKNK